MFSLNVNSVQSEQWPKSFVAAYFDVASDLTNDSDDLYQPLPLYVHV